MVMDATAADKTRMMEEEKGGPSRAMLRSILALGTPCLGPVGLET
jgi:hypothetical protein